VFGSLDEVIALLRQDDFPGTAFPAAAGALTFTSTFLVPPPPPKNWLPNMKSAAATMITKITKPRA
jgi:hypothetical protein